MSALLPMVPPGGGPFSSAAARVPAGSPHSRRGAGPQATDSAGRTDVVTYAVTFTESGLPSGAGWSWTVDAYGSNGTSVGNLTSASSTIIIDLTNGTYSWYANNVGVDGNTYTPDPGSGSLTVSGQPLSQSVAYVTFTGSQSAVTFTEAGLPAGTYWEVDVSYDQGSSSWCHCNSTDSHIVTDVTNGSWQFAIALVHGYSVRPFTGDLVVNGTPVTQSVSFTPVAMTTLVLFNNTLVPGNFPAGNGLEPNAVAYDRGRGEVFVANGETDTVSVLSDTTSTVVATVPVGNYPDALAYDSGKGEVFVANALSNDVSVISDTNNTVIANVLVGGTPQGVAYDSERGEVFVANYDTGNVSVISDRTNRVVATVEIGRGAVPLAVAYDSGQGEVFVTDSYKGNLTVISDRSNTVVATVAVGGVLLSVAYDSGYGEVFVANSLSNTVSVISDTSHAVEGTVAVGAGPAGIAYDFGRGELFVANADSATVSVISDRSNLVVATAIVGTSPSAVVYDSGKGEIFVASSVYVPNTSSPLFAYYSNMVTVISDTNDTVLARVAVGLDPVALAYDSGKGEVFVVNMVSGNVSVISDASNSVVATIPVAVFSDAAVYDSGKGEIFVTGGIGSSVVTVISDRSNAVVASVGVGLSPTALAYDSQKGEVFVANSGSNNVSVLSDTRNTVVATVALTEYPGIYNILSAMAYDNEKAEIFVGDSYTGYVGVISDTNDTVVTSLTIPYGVTAMAYVSGRIFAAGGSGVSVIADANNTVVGTVPVGPWPIAVSADVGKGRIYVADFLQGTLVGMAYPGLPSAMSVTFTESGLPSGTSWSVTVDGTSENSTTTTITFLEPNGTYSFTVGAVPGYAVTPASGAVRVSGNPVTEAITFTEATYAVTFTENQLPFGTRWSVTLNGLPEDATAPSIEFTEPNGTYSYTVGTVSGYAASPSSGALTVNGGAKTQPIGFTSVSPSTYTVTFSETGLPSGRSWSIALNGVTQISSTATVSFTEPNGSYTFSVGALAGYSSSPPSGSVTVAGGSSTVSILFIPASGGGGGSSSSGLLGLSGNTGYYLLGGVAAVVVVGVAVALVLRSRRP